MKILAVETSCDDTCISVLDIEDEKSVFLSDIVSSQIEIHKEWGGIHPTLAAREHQKNLVPVLKKALKKAGLLEKGSSPVEPIEKNFKRKSVLLDNLKKFLENHSEPKIDLLAVTAGPGLDPSLWSGITMAKALALCWDLEVVPVNHIKAHFFAPLYMQDGEFPAISLIVSGGHTQLVLSSDLKSHRVIGRTRDDAAGECFDKTARLLGFSYPGGPEIEKFAKKETKKEVDLPRPMLKEDNYDFSFSGLKTAVLYRWRDMEGGRDLKIAMAKEIQAAIVEVLTEKTFKAVKEKSAKTVILGGGVSANSALRKRFKQRAKKEKVNLIMPDKDLCTDNAKMIAVTAFYEYKNNGSIDPKSLKARPNLKIS